MPQSKPLHPQEVQVYYLLPAIRRSLAIALKQRGVEQKKIAAWFGITDAAISQYISGKRGSECTLPASILQEAQKRAGKVRDSRTAFSQVQELMRLAVSERVVCGICGAGRQKRNCQLCFAGEE